MSSFYPFSSPWLQPLSFFLYCNSDFTSSHTVIFYLLHSFTDLNIIWWKRKIIAPYWPYCEHSQPCPFFLLWTRCFPPHTSLFQQISRIRHVFRSLAESCHVTLRQLPAWSTINSRTHICHGSVVSHRQYKSGLSKLYYRRNKKTTKQNTRATFSTAFHERHTTPQSAWWRQLSEYIFKEIHL